MILSNSFKNSFLKIYKLFSKNTFFLSLLILIIAIIYIVINVKKNINNLELFTIGFSSKLIPFLMLVFIFQFLNWILEAIKFKILLPSKERLPFFMILKAVYVGNLTALITPKRMGNFIGRSMILKKYTNKIVVSTISGNFIQLFTTLLMAFSSFLYLSIFKIEDIFLLDSFITELIIIYGTVLIIFYFLIFNNQWYSIINKIIPLKFLNQQVNYLRSISSKKRFYVILISILRYLVFIFQYFILFNGLMLSFDFLETTILISLLFGIVTFLPSLAPGNLGTREAISILLLGGTIVSIKFSIISFLVWFFNVAISGFIGGLILFYKKGRSWK